MGRGAEGGREQLAAGVLGTVLSQKGRDGGLWPGWVGTARRPHPLGPGKEAGVSRDGRGGRSRSLQGGRRGIGEDVAL